MLNFEPSEVFDIMKESDPHADTSIKSRQGLYVSQTNEPLMDAVLRLLKLLETPQEASFLAPMAVREILFRIMNGAQGEALKQIAMAGSGAFRIADVIKRIKKDYDKPLLAAPPFPGGYDDESAAISEATASAGSTEAAIVRIC
ncbi:hypothetical protein D3C85_1423550 [compost metagenome]